MTTNFDRRNFLKLSAAATATLTLPSFAAAGGKSARALLGKPLPAYKDWKDVYRQQWTWDKVVRGTHFVNCWYQGACSWDVYVKDGLVFREEQAGEYEKVNDELPDYNPRGCQKGSCFSERMYDPTRITHPMRRVGERGSGKWERVTWDEALTDIADSWLDVAVEEGTDRVIWDMGPGTDYTHTTGLILRMGTLTQSIFLDDNHEIGDGRRGTFETFGKISFEGSADDYFHSDLILFWAGNPLYTQIPNAHFFTEAKYRGAKIISIAPDYNASSTKADLWIGLKPMSDAALALGVCRLLIENGKINRDFIREQTDLPLLVREDNHHFLQATDMEEKAAPNRFYVFDEKTQQVKQMPWRSLKLGNLVPALEAKAEVTLKDGSKVKVRTVFDLLKERVAMYTPEKVGEICGIKPGLVRRLATEIGNAKRMRNIAQTTFSKAYHGNLAERAQILIFALTGNIGHKGAGFSGFPFLANEGMEHFGVARTMADMHGMPEMGPVIGQRLAAGETIEMIVYEMTKLGNVPGTFPMRLPIATSAWLFWSIHGGVSELSDNAPDWNRGLKRSVQDHLKEAFSKGWQQCIPKPGDAPRILFNISSNTMRRVRGSQKLDEHFLPKLKKYVVLDMRMTSSARMADYVLPVASFYEKPNFKWVTPLSPYVTASNQATAPLGQSKGDWEILYLLSKKIQQRAKERGIGVVKSPQGVAVDFSKLYDEMSMNGVFTENDGDKGCKVMFEAGKVFGDVSWEQVKEKGFARYTRISNDLMSIGNQTDVPKNDTIVALKNHVVKKAPYPTTTRRIQFYLDHPLYHEYDEVLPRHKDAPIIGGDYPLMLTGGKTRWSIHAAWRDSPLMLRLHRNEPYVLISISDAEKRGIREMDLVRVKNDVGEFLARAALSPAMRPHQAMVYHAWERYQFRGKGDMNSVSPAPINPVELAGGAGQHLAPFMAQGQASCFDRETRVEIELVRKAEMVA